ncbi:invasion associated locus B family protein [Martelella sp. FLE1502]
MFAKRIVLVLVLLFTGASIASAQTPTPIQKFDAWVAYSYQSDAGKVCYALSVPAKKEPANVDHGDNFFVVTKYPGQNVSLEPQAMMGFTLKEGSTIDVVVDGKSFPMYHKGKGGWLENAAQEPTLVAAMKAGRTMEVDATSARGTKTSHTYSLIGITAALNKISTCN